MKKWESYEEVAVHLLDQFAGHFGLERVEGKQGVVGLRSGTTWEIDGKGVCQDGVAFVIIECRCYTTSKQNQEKMGALAYRIMDTAAEGGIVVSPLGLQEGASRVASAERIVDVQLNENCTQYEHVLKFLNEVMVGLKDSFVFTESVEVDVRDKEGNVVQSVKADPESL